MSILCRISFRSCAIAAFMPIAALAAVPEIVIDPPTTPLSPEDALKTFHIEDSYHLELVLSEPQIKEPVVAVFDGNGRMFVAEMRTYMQNIDGKNQFHKASRISMHKDTNGDANYDMTGTPSSSTIYPYPG